MTQDTNKNNLQVEIITQYVKDLSFESPNAPMSLAKVQNQPSMSINVDIEAQELQDNNFEVILKVEAKAVSGDDNVFLAELSFAGVFWVNPEKVLGEQKEMLLLVFCPNLLFPFARRVIADVTRDGGFPPLMINPIDFMALYQSKKKQGAPVQQKSEQSANSNQQGDANSGVVH